MTILVTGAAGLIGQSISRTLVAKGYEVVGLDNAPNAADVLTPLHVKHVHVDLTDIKTTLHVLDGVLEGTSLVGLVNNAAVMQHGETLAWQEFEATLRVNLTAPYALSQHLFPKLSAAKGGYRQYRLNSRPHE